MANGTHPLIDQASLIKDQCVDQGVNQGIDQGIITNIKYLKIPQHSPSTEKNQIFSKGLNNNNKQYKSSNTEKEQYHNINQCIDQCIGLGSL